MKNRYKLMIFDFDGTLGDTKECVVASFRQTFLANGLPDVPRERVVHYMGLSLEEVFRKLTGEAYGNALYEKCVSDYRAFYRELLVRKTLIFPGVRRTLQKIKKQSVLCSVATSKKTEFAQISCQYLAIDDYIDFYIGDDQVNQKKPHPEMLHRTLAEFGVNVQQAVMVGDATTDIVMGKAIGMDTVAVTWGAHSEQLLRTAHPTYVVHRFSELVAFI